MNMQKKVKFHINIKNLETGQNKSRKQLENTFKTMNKLRQQPEQ